MDATVGRSHVVCRAIVFAAAVAACACDSHKGAFVVGGSVMQPSAVSFGSNSALTIDPQFLVQQPVISFGCPLVPPLTTTFFIGVQPRTDLFLDHVTLQFIDGSAIGGTLIPFPRPALIRMFGQTFIGAHTFRRFAFTQGFGCFPSRPTTMSARIGLVDGSGALQEGTLSASIQ